MSSRTPRPPVSCVCLALLLHLPPPLLSQTREGVASASAPAASARTPAAPASDPAAPTPAAGPLMIGTDMARPVLYLLDLESDRMVTLELTQDPKWPGGAPLHTILTPDGRKAYLSIMSSEEVPLMILALRVGEIDWEAGTADVAITKVIRIQEAGIPPSMRVPTESDPSQPVTDLWRPGNHQLHGPTVQPNGKFVYFAQWTDNKIRVIDVEKDELAAVDPIQKGMLTLQNHGVFINPAGTRALGTGYYFDLNFVTVYDVDGESGDLRPQDVVWLTVDEREKSYAAMTHFVDWLDDRWAITASQQTGPTSLTPGGFQVVGPSVWLVDAVEGTGRMIIGPTDTPEGAGIYRAASDVMVVGDKLYVAEEDSMDESIDGSFISVWDLADRTRPRFLRRLSHGDGLPKGWHLSHEFYRAPGGRYLYAQDWHGAHLIKIDPATDTVVKVWSKEAGFVMPHGNFIAGNLR